MDVGVKPLVQIGAQTCLTPVLQKGIEEKLYRALAGLVPGTPKGDIDVVVVVSNVSPGFRGNAPVGHGREAGGRGSRVPAVIIEIAVNVGSGLRIDTVGLEALRLISHD